MQAAQLPKGSMDRLLLVAAFAQSGFAAGLRPYKALNPVMGETLEVGAAHSTASLSANATDDSHDARACIVGAITPTPNP